MNGEAHRDDEYLRVAGDGFAAAWKQMVAEDELPVDEDTFTAYAEGRLTGAELDKVRRLLATSPRAVELLDALGGPFPALPSGAPTTRPTVGLARGSLDQTSEKQLRGERSVWLAVAAGLLLAVGLGISMQTWHNSAQQTALRATVTDLSSVILDSEKAKLATRARERGTVQLAGRVTPELLRTALEDRGGSRAIDPAAEAAREAEIAGSKDRLVSVASMAASEGAAAEIETIWALINADEFDAATTHLETLNRHVRAGQASRGELRNLEALLLMARRRSLGGASEEAEELLAEARTLFREAGEAGVTVAWLNLASTFNPRVPLERDEFEAAVQEFLRREQDESLRAAVQEATDIEPASTDE
jgi:hypothetical protein